MARKIYLSGKAGQGRFTIVDDEDFDFLSQDKWCYHCGYAIRALRLAESVTRCYVLMHTEITGYARADHKNRNKLDNRKENLREVTDKENNRNKAKRDGSTDYIGVSLTKKGLFCAKVENTFYGHYLDGKTAALVVDEVKRRKWAGSIFDENLPNERLPDDFQIVNLDFSRKLAEKQSSVTGVSWNSARARWRARVHDICRTFKTEQEAIDFLRTVR